MLTLIFISEILPAHWQVCFKVSYLHHSVALMLICNMLLGCYWIRNAKLHLKPAELTAGAFKNSSGFSFCCSVQK